MNKAAVSATLGVAALAVVLGGALGLWLARPAPLSTADFMSLSPLPHRLAPNFTLTDQTGKNVSLSDFAGKVIVLEPMDSKCTDICPVIAHEFSVAAKTLGPKASQVVFLGINVNSANNSVSDMLTFTHENGLANLPTWHMLTGSLTQLLAVWKDFNISVQIDPKTGSVIHADQMYFIGPKGVERYVASPFDTVLPNGTGTLSQASTTRWGQGIARYAGGLTR